MAITQPDSSLNKIGPTKTTTYSTNLGQHVVEFTHPQHVAVNWWHAKIERCGLPEMDPWIKAYPGTGKLGNWHSWSRETPKMKPAGFWEWDFTCQKNGIGESMMKSNLCIYNGWWETWDYVLSLILRWIFPIDDIQKNIFQLEVACERYKKTHMSFRGHFIWIKAYMQLLLRDCWVGKSHPNPSFATVIVWVVL